MKKVIIMACCLFFGTVATAQSWNDVGASGFSSGYSYDQILEYEGTTTDGCIFRHG